MKKCPKKPCPNCPWRKSTLAGGAEIPGFEIERMRNLQNTVPPRGSDKDGFRKIMACHKSTDDRTFACAGYAIQAGDSNLNFRLLAMENNIDMGKLRGSVKPDELYDNFYEMLDVYEDALEAQNKA